MHSRALLTVFVAVLAVQTAAARSPTAFMPPNATTLQEAFKSAFNRTTLDDRLAATLNRTRTTLDTRLDGARDAVGARLAHTRNATRAALNDRLQVRITATKPVTTTLIVIAAAIPAATVAAAVVAVFAAWRARAARAKARDEVLAAAVTASAFDSKPGLRPPPPPAPAPLPVQFVPSAQATLGGVSTPRSRRGTPRAGDGSKG